MEEKRAAHTLEQELARLIRTDADYKGVRPELPACDHFLLTSCGVLGDDAVSAFVRAGLHRSFTSKRPPIAADIYYRYVPERSSRAHAVHSARGFPFSAFTNSTQRRNEPSPKASVSPPRRPASASPTRAREATAKLVPERILHQSKVDEWFRTHHVLSYDAAKEGYGPSFPSMRLETDAAAARELDVRILAEEGSELPDVTLFDEPRHRARSAERSDDVHDAFEGARPLRKLANKRRRASRSASRRASSRRSSTSSRFASIRRLPVATLHSPTPHNRARMHGAGTAKAWHAKLPAGHTPGADDATAAEQCHRAALSRLATMLARQGATLDSAENQQEGQVLHVPIAAQAPLNGPAADPSPAFVRSKSRSCTARRDLARDVSTGSAEPPAAAAATAAPAVPSTAVTEMRTFDRALLACRLALPLDTVAAARQCPDRLHGADAARWTSVLSAAAPFAEAAHSLRSRLLRCFRYRTFEPGTTIHRAGHALSSLCIIVTGGVDFSFPSDSSDAEAAKHHLTEGWLLGCDLFTHSQPLNATISVPSGIVSVAVLELSVSSFQDALWGWGYDALMSNPISSAPMKLMPPSARQAALKHLGVVCVPPGTLVLQERLASNLSAIVLSGSAVEVAATEDSWARYEQAAAEEQARQQQEAEARLAATRCAESRDAAAAKARQDTGLAGTPLGRSSALSRTGPQGLQHPSSSRPRATVRRSRDVLTTARSRDTVDGAESGRVLSPGTEATLPQGTRTLSGHTGVGQGAAEAAESAPTLEAALVATGHTLQAMLGAGDLAGAGAFDEHAAQHDASVVTTAWTWLVLIDVDSIGVEVRTEAAAISRRLFSRDTKRYLGAPQFTTGATVAAVQSATEPMARWQQPASLRDIPVISDYLCNMLGVSKPSLKTLTAASVGALRLKLAGYKSVMDSVARSGRRLQGKKSIKTRPGVDSDPVDPDRAFWLKIFDIVTMLKLPPAKRNAAEVTKGAAALAHLGMFQELPYCTRCAILRVAQLAQFSEGAVLDRPEGDLVCILAGCVSIEDEADRPGVTESAIAMKDSVQQQAAEGLTIDDDVEEVLEGLLRDAARDERRIMRIVGAGDCWRSRAGDVGTAAIETDAIVLSAADFDNARQADNALPSTSEVLSLFPILKSFPADQLQALLSSATVQYHSAGTTILREGEQSQAVVGVLSGTCELVCAPVGVTKYSPQRVTAKRLAEGAVYGLSGVLDQELLLADLVATSAARVLVIPMALVVMVLHQGPSKVARAVVDAAAHQSHLLRCDILTAHAVLVEARMLDVTLFLPTMRAAIDGVVSGSLSVTEAEKQAPFLRRVTGASDTASGIKSPPCASRSPNSSPQAGSRALSPEPNAQASRPRSAHASPADAIRAHSGSIARSDALRPGSAALRDPRCKLLRPGSAPGPRAAVVARAMAPDARGRQRPHSQLVCMQHSELVRSRPAIASEVDADAEPDAGAASTSGASRPVAEHFMANLRRAQAKFARHQEHLSAAFSQSRMSLVETQSDTLQVRVPYVHPPSDENWAYVPERECPELGSDLDPDLELQLPLDRLREHARFQMPAPEVLDAHLGDPHSIAAQQAASDLLPDVRVREAVSEEYTAFLQQEAMRARAAAEARNAGVLDGGQSQAGWMGRTSDWTRLWKISKIAAMFHKAGASGLKATAARAATAIKAVAATVVTFSVIRARHRVDAANSRSAAAPRIHIVPGSGSLSVHAAAGSKISIGGHSEHIKVYRRGVAKPSRTPSPLCSDDGGAVAKAAAKTCAPTKQASKKAGSATSAQVAVKPWQKKRAHQILDQEPKKSVPSGQDGNDVSAAAAAAAPRKPWQREGRDSVRAAACSVASKPAEKPWKRAPSRKPLRSEAGPDSMGAAPATMSQPDSAAASPAAALPKTYKGIPIWSEEHPEHPCNPKIAPLWLRAPASVQPALVGHDNLMQTLDKLALSLEDYVKPGVTVRPKPQAPKEPLAAEVSIVDAQIPDTDSKSKPDASPAVTASSGRHLAPVKSVKVRAAEPRTPGEGMQTSVREIENSAQAMPQSADAPGAQPASPEATAQGSDASGAGPDLRSNVSLAPGQRPRSGEHAKDTTAEVPMPAGLVALRDREFWVRSQVFDPVGVLRDDVQKRSAESRTASQATCLARGMEGSKQVEGLIEGSAGDAALMLQNMVRSNVVGKAGALASSAPATKHDPASSRPVAEPSKSSEGGANLIVTFKSVKPTSKGSKRIEMLRYGDKTRMRSVLESAFGARGTASMGAPAPLRLPPLRKKESAMVDELEGEKPLALPQSMQARVRVPVMPPVLEPEPLVLEVPVFSRDQGFVEGLYDHDSSTLFVF